MQMILKVIKDKGGAVLVQGDQGSGKSLLAECLAEGSRTAHVDVDDLLGAATRFTPWLGNHPEVVIVEGSPDALDDWDRLEALIATRQLQCRLRGCKQVLVDTPVFIFCADGALLAENEPPFYTITLES